MREDCDRTVIRQAQTPKNIEVYGCNQCGTLNRPECDCAPDYALTQSASQKF